MGFSKSMNGSNGGRLRSATTTLAEINVTPLVDVILVLLIIFMISAPLMQQGVQVDLPKANATALNDPPEQVLLVLDKGRAIQMNGKPLKAGTLRDRMTTLSAAKPGIEVLIQADQAIPYGFVAQVMAEVKQANIHRVGLVTQPGEKNSSL